jgi:hypothetical protein
MKRLLSNITGVFIGNLSVITVISHYNRCPFVEQKNKYIPTVSPKPKKIFNI